MSGTVKEDMSYTQNRELSWLEFNHRVLQEGCDARVPLLERLKFISIFTSNLDEFFMIRVGSLQNLASLKKDVLDNKTGWTAGQQLDAIFRRLPSLYRERDAAFASLDEQLRTYGICHVHINELNKKDAAFLDEYFHQSLLPVVSPLVIDARHPFPHLANDQLHLFSDIEDAKGNPYFGIISIPTMLPAMIVLPGSTRFILMEELLRDKAATLFQGFRLKHLAVISVTRNADINLDEAVDEMEDNIRQHIKKTLRRRNRMAAVRLEIQGSLSASSVEYLLQHHELRRSQLFYSAAPLRMKYVFSIEELLDPVVRGKLCYPPFQPQNSASLQSKRPIMPQIFEHDALLHYPYESMDPFLHLLKEASGDPSVISIKITIYRMANVSKVAEYLAQAAENGKEVLVLMELRARFDEKNNIDYSERLEQAGCTIIYGFEEYKVHSKICLITCYRDNGIQTITQIGTGNYNEKTARQYTDFSFLTADPLIGQDASAFFKNMLIFNLNGHYRELLAAPSGMKPALEKLFDREIARARRGQPALVIIKCNSISERNLIDKLMEASCAGVRIELIVRGICCIRPGIPGKTENIHVISIIGRFLEHHRVYIFGAQREDLYISSADLMTRNLSRRVELAVPLRDAEIRTKVLQAVDLMLRDDAKAKELLPDGSYRPVAANGSVDAQATFLRLAEQAARAQLYNSDLTEKLNLQRLHAAAGSEKVSTAAVPGGADAPDAAEARRTNRESLWTRLLRRLRRES
ncbi:MAG: polyphosphate kinase 1 [Ndongobacter sp.]|nr:polyphosphate kinase 1 [Ndongobacter sp.]